MMSNVYPFDRQVHEPQLLQSGFATVCEDCDFPKDSLKTCIVSHERVHGQVRLEGESRVIEPWVCKIRGIYIFHELLGQDCFPLLHARDEIKILASNYSLQVQALLSKLVINKGKVFMLFLFQIKDSLTGNNGRQMMAKLTSWLTLIRTIGVIEDNKFQGKFPKPPSGGLGEYQLGPRHFKIDQFDL